MLNVLEEATAVRRAQGYIGTQEETNNVLCNLLLFVIHSLMS